MAEQNKKEIKKVSAVETKKRDCTPRDRDDELAIVALKAVMPFMLELGESRFSTLICVIMDIWCDGHGKNLMELAERIRELVWLHETEEDETQ